MSRVQMNIAVGHFLQVWCYWFQTPSFGVSFISPLTVGSIFSGQHWCRGVLERQRFTRLRSAAIVLQRASRQKLETKNKSAARIQALIRGAIARTHVRKAQKSALRIQVGRLWAFIPVKFFSFIIFQLNTD